MFGVSDITSWFGHMSEARKGMIRVAMETAKTGYTFRRLLTFM